MKQEQQKSQSEKMSIYFGGNNVTRQTNHHFTMIELLTVIAVIVILVGLLLPALSRARESAKRIACLNNQKQVSFGISSYTDSFNDYFPPYNLLGDSWSYAMAYGSKMSTYWQNRSLKYISLETLFCPADTTDRIENYSGTYGYLAIPLGGRQSNIALKKVIHCLSTSKQYLTMDSNCFQVFPLRTTTATNGIVRPRHSRFGINILYVDGHCQTKNLINPDDPYGATMGIGTITDSAESDAYLGWFDYNWTNVPTKNGWFQFSSR